MYCFLENMALQKAQLKGFLPSCGAALWAEMWSFWANCTIKRISSFHELLLSHITFVAKLFVTLCIIKILLSFMNWWANSNKIGSWIDQFHNLLQCSFSSLCFQALAYSQNSHSNCLFPSWIEEMCLYNDLVMCNHTSCLFFVIWSLPCCFLENMALQNAQWKGFLPSCTEVVWTNMISFFWAHGSIERSSYFYE